MLISYFLDILHLILGLEYFYILLYKEIKLFKV